MIKRVQTLVFLLAPLCFSHPVGAQSFETLGTRAGGMGGAFVAVADDASAVYWNPAGLASGAFFSLLIDRTAASMKPDDPWVGGSRSASALALSTPPLGLSYYRLRRTSTFAPSATAEPGDGRNTEQPRDIGVETLVTHHAGVTLVQSVTDRIAIGSTVKIVRGIAASGTVLDTSRDAVLDYDDLIGRASNTVDADVGVMATLGLLRAGLTVRNLREPEFRPAGTGAAVTLHRQARAGLAIAPVHNWLMALDFDLIREPGPGGETRNVAAGLEGRVHRRATVRGGFRVNTLSDAGRRAAITAGGSFAVFGSAFVDAHVTGGAGAADRGWGLAGRVLF